MENGAIRYFCLKEFLITVDYYSNYWELDEPADATSLVVN